jgi:hypothetical protein
MISCDFCPYQIECFENVGQKKIYFFECRNSLFDGCGHQALVCNRCRSQHYPSKCDKRCRMCGKPGELFTTGSTSPRIANLLDLSKKWDEARRLFFDINLQKVKHILSCVGNFKRFYAKFEFYRIDYGMWIRRFFPLDRHNLNLVHRQFFLNVIRTYVPTVRRHSFSYEFFTMTTGLILLTKNMTMAKLLICRLFRVRNRSISFLNAGMHLNKSNDQFSSMVFHHLLSNLQYLIQL